MSSKVPAQVVKLHTIHQTVDVLKQLPKKQKEDFALREAIYEMHQQIEDVLKRGYSFDEVADILSQNDIVIKGVTLKQYLTMFRREKARKRSRSKSRSVEAGIDLGSADLEVSAAKGKKKEVEETMKEKETETVKGKEKSASSRKIGKFVEIPDDL